MLHVTNGDAAAEQIRAAGIGGAILPWRDVLHDGPVPAGLPLERLSAVRAEFLASRGWAPLARARRDFAERDRALAAASAEDEVVLWFEPDLYDQLQLIQLLDWFSDHPHRRLTLVNPPEYLGTLAADHAVELLSDRERVTPEQLALGRAAWEAFRGPDPRRLEEIVYEDGDRGLPFLPDALFRLLQEYPSVDDGLSRSERQALRVFVRDARRLSDAYRAAHHEQEDPVWMGDLSFLALVDALAAEPSPLLAYLDDDPPPPADGARAARLARWVEITDAGREVLLGGSDAVWIHGIDRWIGGVHLAGRAVPWRWDPEENCVVAA